MFLRRSCAMAIAALALVGCASSGYGGSYNQYPEEAYYDGPYDGGGLGYDPDFDDDSNRYFHPAHNVTCDRARDLCYDRYGPSYHATARYLGEREANGAFKKYGDRVFLFSPKRGVTCDRRTQTCSSGGWPSAQSGHSDRPVVLPRLLNPNGKDTGSSGNACPPQGCSNK